MSDRCQPLERALNDLFAPRPRRPRKVREPEPRMSAEDRAEMIDRVRNQPRHPKTCAAIVNRRNADCDCGAAAHQAAARVRDGGTLADRVRNQPRHPKTCAAIVNRRNADCDCGAVS